MNSFGRIFIPTYNFFKASLISFSCSLVGAIYLCQPSPSILHSLPRWVPRPHRRSLYLLRPLPAQGSTFALLLRFRCGKRNGEISNFFVISLRLRSLSDSKAPTSLSGSKSSERASTHWERENLFHPLPHSFVHSFDLSHHLALRKVAFLIPMKKTRCLLQDLFLLDLLPLFIGDHIFLTLLHRQFQCRFNFSHRLLDTPFPGSENRFKTFGRRPVYPNTKSKKKPQAEAWGFLYQSERFFLSSPQRRLSPVRPWGPR